MNKIAAKNFAEWKFRVFFVSAAEKREKNFSTHSRRKFWLGGCWRFLYVCIQVTKCLLNETQMMAHNFYIVIKRLLRKLKCISPRKVFVFVKFSVCSVLETNFHIHVQPNVKGISFVCRHNFGGRRAGSIKSSCMQNSRAKRLSRNQISMSPCPQHNLHRRTFHSVEKFLICFEKESLLPTILHFYLLLLFFLFRRRRV